MWGFVMILRAENLSKRYMRKSGQGNNFYAVKGADLTLESGTVTVVTGRSGSGKTTLLHLLAGLLTPTEGKVWLDDSDLYALVDAQLSRLRNARIGVIPQGRSCVDTLTVLENALLPGTMYGGQADPDAALAWLAALGIESLAAARPAELSGGELRRVAIARALHQNPDVLLADEPTGDLDDENTQKVLQLFRDQAKTRHKIVLLVSHDAEAAAYADRIYRMDGGILKSD